MAHTSTTRLFLRKGKGEQRIAKIYGPASHLDHDSIKTPLRVSMNL
jgi:hypothetical protein